jgi:hypothetical protein
MSEQSRERIQSMRDAVARLVEGDEDQVEARLPDGTTVRLTRDPDSPQGFRSTAFTQSGDIAYEMRSFAPADEAPSGYPEAIPFIPGCMLQFTEVVAESRVMATWMTPDGAGAFGRAAAWHRDAGWREEPLSRSEEDFASALQGLRSRGMTDEMIAETMETLRNAPGARFLKDGLKRELMVMTVAAGGPASMTLAQKTDPAAG